MDKTTLRTYYRTALSRMSPAKRTLESDQIATTVRQHLLYQQASTIFTYISMDEEVDTAEIIRQAWADGKRIAAPSLENGIIVPRLLSTDTNLIAGSLGIPQPSVKSPEILLTDIDLILVPGLAFTHEGVRLGRGGGYFDRWLATFIKPIPTLGLAFSVQIADELPQESHDMIMTSVLTTP